MPRVSVDTPVTNTVYNFPYILSRYFLLSHTLPVPMYLLFGSRTCGSLLRIILSLKSYSFGCHAITGGVTRSVVRVRSYSEYDSSPFFSRIHGDRHAKRMETIQHSCELVILQIVHPSNSIQKPFPIFWEYGCYFDLDFAQRLHSFISYQTISLWNEEAAWNCI